MFSRDEPLPPAAPESQLDELLLRAIGAFEEGGNASVARLLEAHPEQAAALERRIELLRRAGVWGSASAAGSSDRLPERLGEFRLQRVLGAGGMGVVYLAIQESLGREVALKVVRPEHLFFPGARERFRREVETVARLRHPGIVPVYTVGEQQGVPYFAMEYVQGESLEAVLTRCRAIALESLRGKDLAPSPAAVGWLFAGSHVDACLRIVRQVAEALQHAHERGVLHRDIKPSNVMLAADGSSRAMLLDFGLASQAGDASLTRSGARLGSLAYMSPEQVRGEFDRLDARSDVYALGVTLWEMLTLQRAFPAASELQVMQDIQLGNRRRPRELNGAISPEAETVCLKAMDADPARRYSSAADLARDLANVLERRPIEAQRTRALTVARRWVERRPALATAIALGLLLVIAGPSLWIWQAGARASDLQRFNDELKAQLTATRAAQALAQTESERARRAASRARTAIKDFLHRVGNDYLKSIPRADEMRTQLLEDAARLHEEMLAEDPTDPVARAEYAVSLRALGERYSGRGDSVRGDEHLARSLALLREVHVEAPEDPRWMMLLGKTLGERAVVRVAQGSPDPQAEADAEEAVSLLERCLELRPEDFEARHDLAAVQMAWAGLRQEAGDPQTALELLARAEESARVVSDHDPTLRKLLLSIQANMAGALDDADRHEEALSAYGRALSTAEVLLALDPTPLEVRFLQAAAETNFSNQLAEVERLDEARLHGDRALACFESLAADFPTQILFRREVGVCLASRWQLERKAGVEADDLASRARTILESVLERSPEEDRARDELVRLLHAQGLACLKRGDPTLGCELLRSTQDVLAAGAALNGADTVREECLSLLREVLEARHSGDAVGELARDLSREIVGLFPEDSEIASTVASAGLL